MSNHRGLNSIKENQMEENDYNYNKSNYEDVSDVESNSSSINAEENFSSKRSESGNSSYKINSSNENISFKTTTGNSNILRASHLCKDCFRTFKDINNYKEHRFQEHQEKYPNVRQCNMCSYATLLKSKYDCHMRCHLNNKVIKCQRCSYSTINIRHMSKHERMHMISSQAIANAPVPNFLNEKLCKINSLKRKNDFLNNDMNDFSINKYQKTSISSSLSPSSTSSTLSLTIGESNNNNKMNNLDSPANNQIFEFIFKNNSKKTISEECKENRCTAIENSQSKNNETVLTHDNKTLITQPPCITPYSQPLPCFAAKPSNTDTSNFATNMGLDGKLNMTIDQNSFPQNKYKKFLSNFNQQKKFSQTESLEDSTIVKERKFSHEIEKPTDQVNQNNKRALENDKNIDLQWLKRKKFSISNSNENEFKCDLCGLKTKQKSVIYSHSKKHKNEMNGLNTNNVLECNKDLFNFKKNSYEMNKSNDHDLITQSHQITTNQIKNHDLFLNNNSNIKQSTDIQSVIQQQSYFNPVHNLPQQSPALQNLYNTLKIQYPLFPPSYIYSLLSLQQPHNASISNDSSTIPQKSQQFETQTLPQHQHQHYQQQTKPPSTKNTNMFSIENLFTSKNYIDKSVISNPDVVKINNSGIHGVTNGKCCDHKEELFMLRKNVYTMLYKNLPNVLLAFNLLNDPLSPQIDCILESLLGYNQDTRRFDTEPKDNLIEINKFLNQSSLNRPLFSTT